MCRGAGSSYSSIWYMLNPFEYFNSHTKYLFIKTYLNYFTSLTLELHSVIILSTFTL